MPDVTIASLTRERRSDERGEKRRTPQSLDRELRDLFALRDAIRLSTHVLADDPAQLAGQLPRAVGR